MENVITKQEGRKSRMLMEPGMKDDDLFISLDFLYLQQQVCLFQKDANMNNACDWIKWLPYAQWVSSFLSIKITQYLPQQLFQNTC